VGSGIHDGGGGLMTDKEITAALDQNVGAEPELTRVLKAYQGRLIAIEARLKSPGPLSSPDPLEAAALEAIKTDWNPNFFPDELIKILQELAQRLAALEVLASGSGK
jgi:hypothetical protein